MSFQYDFNKKYIFLLSGSLVISYVLIFFYFNFFSNSTFQINYIFLSAFLISEFIAAINLLDATFYYIYNIENLLALDNAKSLLVFILLILIFPGNIFFTISAYIIMRLTLKFFSITNFRKIHA
jgi:hypothetical protein